MRLIPALVSTSALAVALLVAPAGALAATPAPGIAAVTLNGTGCRPGTTTVALNLDRTAVTITYSDYVVPANGSTRTVSRDCRINLTINSTPGYAPMITSVDYRGFAELAAGSVARLTAEYGFQGVLHVASKTMRLAGPYSDDWQATDSRDPGLIAGFCRGTNVLDVDSTLSLTSSAAGAATNLVTLDATDGVVVPNTFRLAFLRCR